MSDSQTVTLSQIESHLWEAANILRGPVDAAALIRCREAEDRLAKVMVEGGWV